MEIVCRPETYRRFKSSSLRQKMTPPWGVFFWRRTSLQKLRIIGGSCEEKSVHASSLLRLSPFRRRFVAQQQYALLCVLRAQNELAETPNYRKFMRGEKRERSPSSPSFSFSTTLCCAATIYFSLRPSGAERACRNSEFSIIVEKTSRRQTCAFHRELHFIKLYDSS